MVFHYVSSPKLVIFFLLLLTLMASLWFMNCEDMYCGGLFSTNSLSLFRNGTVTDTVTQPEADEATNSLIESIFQSSNMSQSELRDLAAVLKNASFDKTVIITPLNQAWAKEGSMVDSLLESFRLGQNTSRYLNNTVMVALDHTAYRRCLEIHPHCFQFQTDGVNFTEEKVFMTPDYLKMTSRKIYFLTIVLQMGYDFVFTDGDIFWFRDPFQHFSPVADFEVSCDYFNGNESDLHNAPNTGFIHVRSNHRTIELYKLWHNYTRIYYGSHDQDVFNMIKFREDFLSIGANIRFLPISHFGCFCQRPNDLDTFCTMHANCCKGLQAKLQDLRMVMDDWKRYLAQTPEERSSQRIQFRAPDACTRSW